MKFALIAKYPQEYPVRLLCRVWEVSVSAASAWKQRGSSPHQREDQELARHIQQVHQASPQSSGSRCIQAALAEQGQICGRKRVVRLMPQLGIGSKPRRHPISTTDSHQSDPVAPHLLARDFTAPAPNTQWVSAITGVWTAQGWRSVAVVLDLVSRLLVETARWSSKP